MSRDSNAGFTDSVSFEEYRRWEEFGSTDLKNVLRSPRYMAAGRAGLLHKSKAMADGSLLDCLVLDPELFGETYAIVPKGMRRDERTKIYQAWLEEFCEGRIPILESELHPVMDLAQAVHDSEGWKRIVAGQTGIRKRKWWWLAEFADTSIPCKGETDWFIELDDRCIIVDLKKTVDSTRTGFAKQVDRYKYYLQAAHYCDGVKVVTGKPCDFIIIAAEFSHGWVGEVNWHMICSADTTTDWHQLGIQERREALRRIATCRTYNTYPPDNDGKVMVLDPPAWKLKDLDDEPFLGDDDD